MEEKPIFRRALSNGVEFIGERVEASAIAAIALRFRAGSRYETAANSGISHFVEHLLFKGTERLSSFDIALAFDTMGGYANAYTDKECVVMYCVVPAAGAEKALETMLEMALHARFGEDEVELERGVILDEIVSSHDDAEEDALDKTAEAVWGKNSMALGAAGKEESVSALTRRQLFNWYKKHFAEGSLSVFAAGKFDTAALLGLLECLPARRLPPGRPKTPAWRAGFQVIPAPFLQEQFFVMFPVASPVSEKRFYALAALNALLGDTMSSRLFRRLREQSGLCYTVYSYNVFFSDCAFFTVYTSASKKNLLRIGREIAAEFAEIKAGGIGAGEIAAAQEHLCGEEMISSEDMEYRMKRLMRNSALGFPLRGTEETLALIRAVTPASVTNEMQALLQPRSRADVVYGPKPAERARAILHSLMAT
jgi:predicted Zn-dependent peptidase